MAPSYSRGIIGVLVAALLIGMVRLWQVPPEFHKGQTDNYWPMAQGLLDGKGFSLCYPLYFPLCSGQNNASAMREPLPVVLFAGVAAITGRSLQAALVLQLIAHLAIVLLLYRWVRSFASERWALIAATVWALYPPSLQTVPQLSGDLIGTALFLAAAIATQRARDKGRADAWAVAGVLLGLAVLCRSVLIITVLPWAVLAWRSATGGQRRSRLAAAALVGCMALIVSPWVVRNAVVFHRFWPGTSMNGYNLFRNNYQVRDGQPPHYVAAIEAQEMMNALLARRTDLRGNENEAEMDRVYMEEGRKALAANPMGYVTLSLYRFIPLWTNWGVPQQYGRPVTLFDHAMLWQQLLLLALLIFGAWRAGPVAWPWLAAIVLQVLAYMAVVAQVRYLLPVMPLVIGMAVWGLSSGRSKAVPAKG